MISFDRKNETFYLHTKNVTYAMGLCDGNKLLHRYWGKRLKNPLKKIDLMDFPFRSFAAMDLSNTSSDVVPFEYSAFGTDLRVPSVEFTFSDGTMVAQLTYQSHEITEGKPKLKGLPATYCEEGDAVQTLRIHLADTLQNIEVVLSYSVFEAWDAITRSVEIINHGERMVLDAVMSATVDFYGSPERELIHLDGAWARERFLTKQPIVHGNQGIDSRYGCSSAFHNPFIALCDKNTTENYGNVYAFNLVYSGNFKAGVERNAYGCDRAYIGIHPTDFRFVLEKGDSFQAPEAVLVYSATGLGEMSRIFHRLYRTRLCRGKYRDIERFALINNWEATYFDFNEDKIVEIAEKARQIGIDTMVLDDGWFSSRLSDKNGLGDWYENRDRLPNGLEGLSKRIHEKGMRFGLWFEPEMVNPGTELFRKHPDWVLQVNGRKPALSRNQFTLDLSREDVCDYIIETVGGILSRVPIEYVKWDMNRTMSEPGSMFWNELRQGEVMHRYMLGLYRVLETLTQRFPDVLFEGCAGGGARFDPGLLYYVPQIWTSDDTDAVERLKIQYGTSMVYPFSTMGAHVSAVPNHQLHRRTSFEMRCYVAVMGQFGFELDLNQCTDEELATAKKTIETYRKYGAVFHRGDCYRLKSPFEDNLFAAEFISEDQDTVILIVACSQPTPNAPDTFIRFRGLDETAVYQLEGSDQRFYGDHLVNIGWHFLNNQESQSLLLIFHKI
ncbi:MAG: alpha-galactosidase [Clostridia bacterium]|nr:alpha-galactosidase [Clostridia bacterium]